MPHPAGASISHLQNRLNGLFVSASSVFMYSGTGEGPHVLSAWRATFFAQISACLSRKAPGAIS
jgi:hypothetical protein